MILAIYLEELNAWYQGVQNTKDWANIQVINHIEKNLGLTFVPKSEGEGNVCLANSPEVRDNYKEGFTPLDLLDYIYAVLHSPTYRKKHEEFSKVDFARVPYPKKEETFWHMVALGGDLRELHLLESTKVEGHPTPSYPIEGDNVVTRTMCKEDWETYSPNSYQGGIYGKIWINENQFFDNIPLVAWELYIGSYRPAQKWLKARRGHILDSEDIRHYQKIIVSLTETHRLLQEIDSNALTPLQ